jgi:prepilin-type N-terminal cleavage/methylation domain-containing protein
MRQRLSGAAASGLTLIEVMIVIAILAIAVAIVYPNLVRRDTPAALSEAQLIEQAKTLAVARAEPVRLSIETDGTWEIVSEGAPGSGALASGHLAEAPAYAVKLRVTELGACFDARDDRRIEGPAVDAVSCTIRP